MCTRMSMDIRVHIGRNPRSQLKNKQGDSRGPTTHRGWTMTLRNQLLNALNFMTSTDAIAADAFVLITNLFVIKTNAFFAAIASVLVMKFKALEQLIS